MSLMFLIRPILAMVDILSGFTLIPHSIMMYPRSFPRGIPNVHFFGFSLMLNHRRLLRVSSKSEMRL
jgi:hypothetical protein